MLRLLDNPNFKQDPDALIRAYVLPIGKNSAKQKIGENLWLRLRKVGRTKKRTHIDYYFGDTTNIISSIGCVNTMTYHEALREARKRAKEAEQKEKQEKNSLRTIFAEYMDFYSDKWKPATVSNKTKTFSKIKNLSNKSISSITLAQLEQICDRVKKDKKYATLSNLCELIDQIWQFARMRRYVTKDLFDGISMVKRYPIPQTEGFGWIDSVDDLKLLIRYICGYPHTTSVKNALKMGLVSALRAGNIRTLGGRHLRLDENGEYYLQIPKDEMKIRLNRDEFIGLPSAVGKWLQSLENQDIYFANSVGKPLSDAILSKSLRTYCALEPNGRIVFHSFRKIFSTFMSEHKDINGVDIYDVERVLSHSVPGVMGVYNKSTNVKNTRKALTWWFNYLVSLGFEL